VGTYQPPTSWLAERASCIFCCVHRWRERLSGPHSSWIPLGLPKSTGELVGHQPPPRQAPALDLTTVANAVADDASGGLDGFPAFAPPSPNQGGRCFLLRRDRRDPRIVRGVEVRGPAFSLWRTFTLVTIRFCASVYDTLCARMRSALGVASPTARRCHAMTDGCQPARRWRAEQRSVGTPNQPPVQICEYWSRPASRHLDRI
jgi:hypothetical protein